ncbi:hypothetical protein PG999_003370 [Apiospora kogelbergensis]|uniref:AA1-like domain-containing protein n=1 Tax=Apiospora kogelbergensis TaxID=1337665 RepID=A0AAW0R3H0_9PEZI
MTFLIILSFMLSLVASLPGPPVNRASLAITKQPGGHKTYHNLKAQFNFSNWILIDVTFDCRRPSISVLFDCAFKFHWDDPNFNASASCDRPWKWDGVTMEQGANNTYNNDEYFICEEHKESPEAWQLKFYNMTNDGLFELGLIHDCIDEQIRRDVCGTLRPDEARGER